MKALSLVTFVGLVCSLGCSTGKLLLQRDPSIKLGYVAFLPVEPPEDARLERVELVRAFVENELKRKGYLVVEQNLVKPICPSPKCAEKEELFNRFQVDALVKLELEKVSSRNLLLGYTDSINGKLNFEGRTGSVIESVSHSSQRSGGLLLNSGQVVEAIETQTASFKDSTFEPLARDFARSIVSKVSQPSGLEARFALGSISEISLERGARQEKVCLNGPPGSFVLLVSEEGAATLREVQEGRYCAALESVRPIIDSDFRADLRTPSGLSTERKFTALKMPSSCNLNGLVALSLEKKTGVATLEISCGKEECKTLLAPCESARKIVYRAEDRSGPFKKLGEFVGRTFSDRPRKGVPAFYSIILKTDGLSETNQPVLLAAGGL